MRDGQANEFEQRDALQLCRDIFHSVQDDFVRVIDADRTIEEIHAAILDAVAPVVGPA